MEQLLRKLRRHGRNFRKPLIVVGILALFVWVFSINYYIGEAYVRMLYGAHPPLAYLIDTPGCRVIEMDPYHPQGQPYLLYVKRPLKCQLPIVRLVDDMLVYNDTHKFYNSSTCCCSIITRPTLAPDNITGLDSFAEYSEPCKQVPRAGMKMPGEFVRVTCSYNPAEKKKDDIYYYAKAQPLRLHSKSTAAKEQYWKSRTKTQRPIPSVLIIGISSVSRNSFVRSMPATRKYLSKNDFINLNGYSKPGDSFMRTLLALLVGLNMNDSRLMAEPCFMPEETHDNCSLIWKNFSRLNYVTGYFQDAPLTTSFSSEMGFEEQPTDYYFRPLSAAYLKRGLIGEGHANCIGGYSETEILMNYTQDFLQATRDVPYFLFNWHVSAAHKDINALKQWDAKFKKFFEDTLTQSKYSEHDPIIIFLSDEGQSHGFFRTTFLGFHEEGLPFALIRVPKSIKEAYPHWYENLKVNNRRFTTPADIYATLEDVLRVVTPHGQPSQYKFPLLEYSADNQTAYSLFGEIPTTRNCQTARIPEQDCRCGVEPHERLESELAEDMLDYVVEVVNDQVASEIKQEICVPMEANDLAYLMVTRDRNVTKDGNPVRVIDMLVGVEVAVSNALFEALFRYYPVNQSAAMMGRPKLKMTHGEQSLCLDDGEKKDYCLCKDYHQSSTSHVHSSPQV